MSVVAFRGRDADSEARTLLNHLLPDGEVIGTDDASRTALLLMLDPFTLDRLLAFDAAAADLEANDVEPESVVHVRPPKRRRAGRLVQAIAVALLIVAVPNALARADQANTVAPLPMSTAQSSQQCCRVLPQRTALWRQLYQRRKAVQAVNRLRVLCRQ